MTCDADRKSNRKPNARQTPGKTLKEKLQENINLQCQTHLILIQKKNIELHIQTILSGMSYIILISTLINYIHFI